MESLKNKTVLITGATSGIGRATAFAFARQGAHLIIAARRSQLLQDVAEAIRKSSGVPVLAMTLDVRDRSAVEQGIRNLPAEFKKIDILVNNAGLARGMNRLYEDDPAGWEEMIDTNVKGLLYVTRAVVPGMTVRGSGHVINIGSIAGHEPYPKGAVYCATKHAVSAITSSLRMDLIDKGVRVSTVDPGMVETDFSNIRFYGDKERAKKTYQGVQALTGEDIAEAIVFIATRPKHANINEIIMMPSVQASATLTYRK